MALIVKTKARETLKLYNHISEYLFEQECGELKGVPHTEVNKLKASLLVLSNIINKHKQ